MKRIQYINPPIREVAFEIRFSKNSSWDPTVPGLIFGMLKNNFPIRERSNEVTTEITQGPDGVHQNFIVTDSVLLKNQEGTISVQISQNRLGVTHTTPYSSWDNYLKFIHEVIEAYTVVANPSEIERIGLRYINEIPIHNIAVSNIELKDYFNIYPHLESTVDEGFDSFIIGLQFPYNNRNDLLKVQLANGDNGIIFDLDYFSNNKQHLNFESIPHWLENAHNVINTKFEGGITHRLRTFFREVEEL